MQTRVFTIKKSELTKIYLAFLILRCKKFSGGNGIYIVDAIVILILSIFERKTFLFFLN